MLPRNLSHESVPDVPRQRAYRPVHFVKPRHISDSGQVHLLTEWTVDHLEHSWMRLTDRISMNIHLVFHISVYESIERQAWRASAIQFLKVAHQWNGSHMIEFLGVALGKNKE